MTDSSPSWAVPTRLVNRVLRPTERWAFADQALVSGANFATTVILGRALGLEVFGTYTLIWMGIQLLNNITIAVISAPMLSIGPLAANIDDRFYYGAVWIHQVAIWSIAVVVIGIGFLSAMAVHVDSFRPIWLWAAAAATCFQFQDFLRRMYFSRARPRSAFCNDLISYGGQIVILCLLWENRSLSLTRSLIVMSGTSAAAVLSAIGMISTFRYSRVVIEAVTRRHWSFSRWLLASTVLEWPSSQATVLIPPIFLGPAAAATIRSAQAILGVMNVWFQGLQNVLPIESRAAYRKGGRLKLVAYVRAVTLRWGIPSAVLSVALACSAPVVLRTVYGRGFASVPSVLVCLALASPVSFACLPVSAGLRTIEDTRPIFLAFAVAAVSAILFSFGGAMIGKITICAAGALITRSLQFYILKRAFVSRMA